MITGGRESEEFEVNLEKSDVDVEADVELDVDVLVVGGWWP